MSRARELPRIVLLLSVALMLSPIGAFAQAGGKKPNIVILMTDDTGWVTCQGEEQLSAIQPRTSIASRRKARFSQTGMARLVAPPAALLS